MAAIESKRSSRRPQPARKTSKPTSVSFPAQTCHYPAW